MLRGPVAQVLNGTPCLTQPATASLLLFLMVPVPVPVSVVVAMVAMVVVLALVQVPVLTIWLLVMLALLCPPTLISQTPLARLKPRLAESLERWVQRALGELSGRSFRPLEGPIMLRLACSPAHRSLVGGLACGQVRMPVRHSMECSPQRGQRCQEHCLVRMQHRQKCRQQPMQRCQELCLLWRPHRQKHCQQPMQRL